MQEAINLHVDFYMPANNKNYSKKYYETHKEEISRKNKEKYLQNKERMLVARREYYDANKELIGQRIKENIQSSPRKWLANSLRRCKRNEDCDLSLDSLLSLWSKQGGRCAISGLEMEHQFHSLKSASVDRIDSEKGYVVGNIQLVCRWANLAKNSGSNEEIITIINEVKANA